MFFSVPQGFPQTTKDKGGRTEGEGGKEIRSHNASYRAPTNRGKQCQDILHFCPVLPSIITLPPKCRVNKQIYSETWNRVFTSNSLEPSFYSNILNINQIDFLFITIVYCFTEGVWNLHFCDGKACGEKILRYFFHIIKSCFHKWTEFHQQLTRWQNQTPENIDIEFPNSKEEFKSMNGLTFYCKVSKAYNI